MVGLELGCNVFGVIDGQGMGSKAFLLLARALAVIGGERRKEWRFPMYGESPNDAGRSAVICCSRRNPDLGAAVAR